MCTLSGRRIVEMVWEQFLPSEILTMQAYENAIMVDMAIGGSTNAIIHLTALAGRSEIPLNLENFDRVSAEIPLLLNLRPSEILDGGLLLCRRTAGSPQAIGGIPLISKLNGKRKSRGENASECRNL